MLTIFFIFFFGFFQARNGLGHRIRHGRTRYVSGKNQIFESGHDHDTEEGNFWERPLQILESSLNVTEKRFSRPLFSWDVSEEGNASSKNQSDRSPKEKSPGGVLHSSKSVRKRPNRVGHDPARILSSHAYPSTPKKKANNRKKSSEENKKRERHWNTNESVTKKRKKGRKSGRVKGGTKSKNNSVEIFIPGLDSKKASSLEYLHKNRTTAKENSNGKNRGKENAEKKDSTTSSCDLMESKCEHACREINGKAVCMCYKGFRPVGTRCLDVNECEKNNGGCNGKCINTIGSWKCVCSTGFRLVEGTCTDVNECLLRNGHGTCQDRCTNTVGSYRCSCEGVPGTRLSSDGHTCERSHECDPDSEGCSHSCVSISGRIFCTCPYGFELGDDWKNCRDVDECLSPSDYDVECPFECINTLGSYKCSTMGNDTTEFL